MADQEAVFEPHAHLVLGVSAQPPLAVSPTAENARIAAKITEVTGIQSDTLYSNMAISENPDNPENKQFWTALNDLRQEIANGK